MKIDKNQYFVIGDRFVADEHTTDKCELMLCQCDHKSIVLIELKTGNRWRAPIKINNAYHITGNEFMEIAGKMNLERLSELTEVHIKEEPRIIKRIYGFVKQEFIQDFYGHWTLDKQEFCSTEDPDYELIDIVTDAKPCYPFNLG